MLVRVGTRLSVGVRVLVMVVVLVLVVVLVVRQVDTRRREVPWGRCERLELFEVEGRPRFRRRIERSAAHAALPLRSMRTTATAAPKPLSIFTTVTPDAQLVSMPSSAVKPESAVP